jgi:hypothetical protein
MIRKEGSDYVAEVHGAISIANSLAYVSECIDPIYVFIGFTRRDLMTQAVRFILFGEGETGLMFHTILLRYWDSPRPGRRTPSQFPNERLRRMLPRPSSVRNPQPARLTEAFVIFPTCASSRIRW